MNKLLGFILATVIVLNNASVTNIFATNNLKVTPTNLETENSTTIITGDESVAEYLAKVNSRIVSETAKETTRPTGEEQASSDCELMVVLKKEFSNPYYHMTPEHFPGVKITYLKEYLKAKPDGNLGLINPEEYRSILLMRFANNADLEEAITILEGRADIWKISYNMEIELVNDPVINSVQSGNTPALMSTSSYLSDPLNENYYFSDMQMDKAWEITMGSQDVKIGILDSGCNYTHTDLTDNIWTNPDEIAGNGIDDDGNGYIDDIHGWNFCGDNGNVYETGGHGTNCASVAGAVGNNGIGFSGSSPNVSLVIFKVLGAGFTSENYIDIVNYAMIKIFLYCQ